MWYPVKLSGSAEKVYLLDLDPGGLLVKAEWDLVSIHKTSFGCLITLENMMNDGLLYLPIRLVNNK